MSDEHKRGDRGEMFGQLVLAGCLVVGIGAVILAIQFGESGGQEPPPPPVTPCENGADAYFAATQILSRQLKSPGTAEWAAASAAEITYLGTCEHRIRAWVDAENSFGGHRRVHFTAEVAYLPAEKQWELQDYRWLE